MSLLVDKNINKNANRPTKISASYLREQIS